MINRPDLLLCDEPTGNVDPEMAGRLLHLFQELNRLGTTVVVATHAMQLLPRIPAATIMRLERGRMQAPSAYLHGSDDRAAATLSAAEGV